MLVLANLKLFSVTTLAAHDTQLVLLVPAVPKVVIRAPIHTPGGIHPTLGWVRWSRAPKIEVKQRAGVR